MGGHKTLYLQAVILHFDLLSLEGLYSINFSHSRNFQFDVVKQRALFRKEGKNTINSTCGLISENANTCSVTQLLTDGAIESIISMGCV